MISVLNLVKNYDKKQALIDVSFEVKQGEIVGLIEKNGAGKTTILKSIAGLQSYDCGAITYNGIDIQTHPEMIRDFGILIECAFLEYINAYDNLKLLYLADARLNTAEAGQCVDEILSLVDLQEVKTQKVKSYSFGMKQRLGLAQAILSAKSFLMLDEPFIGLDPVGKEIVKHVLLQKAKEEGFSILFSSHDLPDVAEICDRVIMIEEGVCKEYDINLKLPGYRIRFFADAEASRQIAEGIKPFSAHLIKQEIVFQENNAHDLLNTILKIIYCYEGKVEEVAQLQTAEMIREMFHQEGVQYESI